MSTDTLEPIQLRDGSVTLDPRLDRIVQYDERSRNYQVRELLDDPATRRDDKGKASLPAFTLNQRREGQCVLDCCVGLRDGSPHRRKPPILDFETRRGIYHQLQHNDPWQGCSLGGNCPIEPDAGNAYGGTSVLAGAQYGLANGWWQEYRWIGAGSGQLEDDLIDTLRLIGMIGFGIPWLEGMYRTSPSGLLMIEGAEVGGHAIKGFEWAPRQRMPQHWTGTRPGVWLHNTWGPQKGETPQNTGGFGVSRRGVTGCAFVELDPLLSLLNGGRGEGMVPIKRALAA